MITDLLLALAGAGTLVGLGVLLLLVRAGVEALERIGRELRFHREAMHGRLGTVIQAMEVHTMTTREVADAAPDAVVAERDKLAEDYQRLAAATAVALQYKPDPTVGTYQAGAAEAVEHMKATVQAAL